MPKEIVQYPATVGKSSTELSVHWDKGGREVLSTAGYVQIAATRHVWIPDESSGHSPRQHADHTACAECVPLQVDDDDNVPHSVFTDPLGRGEINALIRALRRARDQAFGPDA